MNEMIKFEEFLNEKDLMVSFETFIESKEK
jgi:hypothetical protein